MSYSFKSYVHPLILAVDCLGWVRAGWIMKMYQSVNHRIIQMLRGCTVIKTRNKAVTRQPIDLKFNTKKRAANWGNKLY